MIKTTPFEMVFIIRDCYETVYSYGHELRRLQRPGGEGGGPGAGGEKLRGEPAYQFHGRGRHGGAGGDYCGGQGRRLRRFSENRRKPDCSEDGGRGCPGGSGDTGSQAASADIPGLFTGAHVCFHGP